MLKIKDNVDLKELEKYGFNYDKRLKEYQIGEIFNGFISIDVENRLLMPIYDENMWINMEDILYDLIKNNLVEKVENNVQDSSNN